MNKLNNTGVVNSEEEPEGDPLAKRSGMRRQTADLEEGRDEMNLVEFPLSGITDRFLDGRKTVIFSDHVWDRDRRDHLPRELAISGSDRYGLPTAKDEDVLLACLQLSSLVDFQQRDVQFSRYEMLKLLRWPDEGKNYQRLSTSLRRWKGVTIFSNRAFYDHAAKSWVNRDFGVFDNLTIYERDSSEGTALSRSRFVWNEVLFRSFQAGYLKRLDWDLYCRLTDPVAKRLYRLLDKRFYHGDEVVFNLHDLAFRRIRMSNAYNTAQIKRALARGIAELETLWQLRKVSAEKRFVKLGRGRWNVVFQRQKPRRIEAVESQIETAQVNLEIELSRRGIGPAMAADLVSAHSAETINTMLALFDWYQGQGKPKGPGFLVDSIRRAPEYRLPRDFVSAVKRQTENRPSNSRKGAGMKFRERRPVEATTNEKSQRERFAAFWNDLSHANRQAFEADAVKMAEPMKRDGYLRLRTEGGPAFEHYRQLILSDHFELISPATVLPQISSGGKGRSD